MEADRFDQFVRALTPPATRRGLARFAAAGALAAGAWQLAAGDAAGKKKGSKKKKRCKPACPECRFCRKGKCKPVANGTPCESADVCQGGLCVAEGCGAGPACVSPQVCVDEECILLFCGNGGPCRVFTTFTTPTLLIGAELGGLEGADALCQTTADDAELAGTFMAWLSAGSEGPANRFVNRELAGPYLLPPSSADGAGSPPTVSPDFATLISCSGGQTPCLLHPIDRTADGDVQLVEDFPVWTGTLPNGTASADDCDGWTGPGLGLIGNATVTGGAWTNTRSEDCELFGASLYCFEQASGPS